VTQLASELAIPKSLLHDWLNGRQPSFKSLPHVKSLAIYLGLSLDELLVDGGRESLISSIVFSDGDRKYKINIERMR